MPRAPANPYTMAEKRRILQYIIEHHAYYQVKGNALWIKMESEFRNTHSWQSLKEHYKKRLVPSLALADFKLTEEQIANFRRGSSGILNIKKKKQPEASSPVPFYKLWSDEEDDKPLAAGLSKSENSESKEVSDDKPGPKSSSSSHTSHKENIPVPKKENGSQVPAAGSTSASKPIMCSDDSSEDEYKTVVDSQTLSSDIDSDVTYVDSDECIDDSRFLK